MGSFLTERIFQSTPNGVLMCVTEAFSSIGAVHIEFYDCGGWWLSGCCGSVAEHWRLKPEVYWVQLPVTAGFFTFLYFRLMTSKFIFFQREAKCSEQQYIVVCCNLKLRLHVALKPVLRAGFY